MPKQYTPQEVLKVMRKVSLMSLAVSDKNNQPESHMMLFAIEDDFTMYFATVRGSGKHIAIQHNNKIGLSVWSDKEMLIQILATATEVEGKDVMGIVDKLADAATEIENFWPPVLQIMKDSYIVFKVKPNSIRALDLTTDTITNADVMFNNIGEQL